MLTDFRSINRVRGVNRAVQIVLALALLVLLNVVSTKLYWRLDLSEDNRFSLSAETRAYLKSLPRPVEIYLTEPGENAGPEAELVFNDLRLLLAEYDEAASRLGGQIQIETIDVIRQHRRATELVDRFGVDPRQRNALIVASGERFHVVEPGLLYDMTDDGRNLFKGERAITSALLQVTEEAQPVAYFLAGHGEMLPQEVDPLRGMSDAAAFLGERNWDVRTLQLGVRQGVPEDAALVIVAGPQTALLPIEEAHLRTYLDSADGRLLLLAEPLQDHGLEELLSEWGVRTDDMVIVEMDPEASLPGGDMLVSSYAAHPITAFLRRGGFRLLLGLSRPAREDPAASPNANRTVTPLALTSAASSWAESGYRRRGNLRFDPESDLPAPVPVAIASERRQPTEVGVERPAGRLVVLGTSSVFSNQRLNADANLVFFNQIVNWLADGDSELLNIPPRAWRPVEVNLTSEQMQQMWFRLLYLPGGAFVLAGVVALVRRR